MTFQELKLMVDGLIAEGVKSETPVLVLTYEENERTGQRMPKPSLLTLRYETLRVFESVEIEAADFTTGSEERGFVIVRAS